MSLAHRPAGVELDRPPLTFAPPAALRPPDAAPPFDPHADPVPTLPAPRRRVAPSAVAVRDRPYNRRVYVELTRATDVAMALLGFGIAFVALNADAMQHGLEQFVLVRLSLVNLATLGVFVVAWQLHFLLFGLYDATVSRRIGNEAASIVAACTLTCAFSLLPALWSTSRAYNATVVLLAWPLTVLGTLATRYLARVIAGRVGAAGRQRVVIVGSGPLAMRVYDAALRESHSRHEIIGFVDSNPEIASETVRGRLLGCLEELDRLLMHTVVDEVWIALPIRSRYAEIQRVIEQCERAGIQSRYSAEVFDSRLARPCVEPTSGPPAVTMKVVTDDYRLVVKRALDIVVSGAGLLALTPLLVAIALAVRLDTPGPVFFGQERYGWRKRRFTMWKFRTMVVNAEALQATLESHNEAAGPVFKIRHDPRITRVGRFLRRTSLDELPQLWNVLHGDMSLVGPRPLPMRDVNRFDDAALMRRFSVQPGITGLWQVSGRSDLPFAEWIQLDLRYIDRWSLRLDAEILVRTIPAVLKGTGAA